MTGALQKISNTISGSIEKFFFRHGVLVGSRPGLFILLPVALTALAVFGIRQIKVETRLLALWVPSGSKAEHDRRWVKQHFPRELRVAHVMFVAKGVGEEGDGGDGRPDGESNVLTKDVLLAATEIREKVNNIKVEDENGTVITWKDVCTKVDGPSSGFPGSTPGDRCIEFNPAGLWDYDKEVIKRLSPEEISTKIWFSANSSRIQAKFNYSTLLARTSHNEKGELSGAGVLLIRWLADRSSNQSFTKEATHYWEKGFLEIVRNTTPPRDVEILYDTPRSFHDVQEESLLDDMIYLYAGYALVFVYVITVLGRRNCLEFKAPLALAGLLSVTMSLVITLGVCGLVGIPHNSLNTMVAFLALGLGIDDMFVIVQCHENIETELRRKGQQVDNLPLHLGKVMTRAGAAVSVTSLTDFVAFAIGMYTSIPALRWFCQASCLSISTVFIFQSTFFPACLVYDIRRQRARRSSVFCCVRLGNGYEPSACSRRRTIDLLFENLLAQHLFKPRVRAFVLVASFAALGFGLGGALRLERSTDELNVLPRASPPAAFFRANRRFFTSDKVGAAYFGDVDYEREMERFEQLRRRLTASEGAMIKSVEAWPKDFLEFSDNFNNTLCSRLYPKGRTNFGDLFRAFLCCRAPQYNWNFEFDEPHTCDRRKPPPRIRASFLSYEHYLTFNPVVRANSAKATRKVVEEFQLKSKSTNEPQGLIYSTHYGFWEGEETMIEELFRNLTLTSGFVLLVTLVLIASVPACLLVALSVCMTLADALGTLYFLGVSIDTVSSLLLIAAIGLSVDFSSHIAHTFMSLTGTKRERARLTLVDIGPAVLHGGTTTLLAFSLLYFSEAFVFQVFCKTFFSVVLCGLYHGLVFLPVMLSYIGPAPYATAGEQEVDQDDDAHGCKTHIGSIGTADKTAFNVPQLTYGILLDPKQLQSITSNEQDDRSAFQHSADSRNRRKTDEAPNSIRPGSTLKSTLKIHSMPNTPRARRDKKKTTKNSRSAERKPKAPPPDYEYDSSSDNDETRDKESDTEANEWESHIWSSTEIDESDLPPYSEKREPKTNQKRITNPDGLTVPDPTRRMRSPARDSIETFLTSSVLTTGSGRFWIRTSPASPYKLKRSSSESTFRSHRHEKRQNQK